MIGCWKGRCRPRCRGHEQPVGVSVVTWLPANTRHPPVRTRRGGLRRLGTDLGFETAAQSPIVPWVEEARTSVTPTVWPGWYDQCR